MPISTTMGSTSAQRMNPNYGRGVASAEIFDGEDVLRALEKSFSAPNYKPPVLPRAAVKLNQLTSNPNCDVRQILSVLSEDTQMVGRILKLMQTPTYGGAAKILSLQQALSRLGLRGLRDVVFQVALGSKVFRNKAYQGFLDRLQFHSVACAHIAKIVCSQVGLDSDHAFLCGLMHDVGMAGAITAISEAYGKKSPPIEDIWGAVEHVHASAGARMAELWELPEQVREVIELHGTIGKRGQENKMASVVCVANALAISAGHSLLDGGQRPEALLGAITLTPDGAAKGVFQRACLTLGFSKSSYEALQAEVLKRFQKA